MNFPSAVFESARTGVCVRRYSVNGSTRIAFADKRGVQPEFGDEYEVLNVASNPSGNVWFLTLGKRLSTFKERSLVMIKERIAYQERRDAEKARKQAVEARLSAFAHAILDAVEVPPQLPRVEWHISCQAERADCGDYLPDYLMLDAMIGKLSRETVFLLKEESDLSRGFIACALEDNPREVAALVSAWIAEHADQWAREESIAPRHTEIGSSGKWTHGEYEAHMKWRHRDW